MHMKLIFAFLLLGCGGALAAESDLAQRISAAVEKQASDDAFSGIALVAQNGTPVFEGAYGLAGKEMNRRNTKTTKFNLGSINKSFTAVAIAQLAEEAKLAYSDTIAKRKLLGPEAVAGTENKFTVIPNRADDEGPHNRS